MKNLLKVSGFLAAVLYPQLCFAVSSAELYTSKAYGYGRFEARARFAAGDGVISSFFLWKDGSEKTGTFWNELDFEKVGADCHVETNAIFGDPSASHSTKHALQADLCGVYHTYAYEWTPDTITWLVDGTAIRSETGATAQAYAENASAAGMQFHFNVWPGDATFGGNFDPATLPLHQYIDWVQYSSYESGAFTLAWREDFTAATLPEGWLTGNWASPKNKSTHAPENVNFIDGFAVLSLTADNALGPAGATPGDSGWCRNHWRSSGLEWCFREWRLIER
jgi:endo-1,3-1,4-beta-glycanase ExoK